MLKKSLYLFCVVFLAISNVQAANGNTCKNLKSVHELKDLLEQLYVNLDSTCILKMTDSELIKIWGIPIVSQVEKLDFQQSNKAMSKPYTGGVSHLVIYRRSTQIPNEYSLHIYSTRDYKNKHTSLFPDGKLPFYLPKPIIEYVPSDFLDYYPNIDPYSNFLGKNHQNDFFKVIEMYWEDSKAKKNNLPRIDLKIESDAAVTGIIYSRHYMTDVK